MTIAWLQIIVTTDRTALAEAVFEQWGADAITELDIGDELTVELTPHSHPAFSRSRIVGLFKQDTDADPIVDALTEVLGANAEIERQTLANENWASTWLAQHPPLRFGDHLWIAPHEAPIDTEDQAVVVRLDPGLAFGTGTHPSTALCLRWLASQDLRGLHVLDYGCGSGILSIAAACLGADSVVAVDIDEQATRATRENAARNAVSDRIQTPDMGAIDSGRFDVVLANILAKPLIELAPTLCAHAAPSATLVLAGLLTRQINEVSQAYSEAFDFGPSDIEDGWARLTGRKRQS
ncbi:MAG: 50S ribosomal protein L11 methyltransferase [Salinisphaera sp.]|nr:50S ribosomal protein L11 methyltransferase [Salinisphaera sp.]